MSAQAKPHLTPEQYLQLDRKSEMRSEYYNGRMFAMAGGTYNHARIAANLSGELYSGLKKTTCHVCSNHLRVRVASAGLYTYSDILIACGEPKFADSEKDTLLSPTLIVEVSFAIH